MSNGIGKIVFGPSVTNTPRAGEGTTDARARTRGEREKIAGVDERARADAIREIEGKAPYDPNNVWPVAAERDPHGIDPKSGGAKMDLGKAAYVRLLLDYFPDALTAVTYVSEYGERKYHTKGWEKVPDGVARYGEAKLRHVMKEIKEGVYDETDSGLAHAAQEAWNALARLQLMIRDGVVDIRRGNDLDENNRPILGTARKV